MKRCRDGGPHEPFAPPCPLPRAPRRCRQCGTDISADTDLLEWPDDAGTRLGDDPRTLEDIRAYAMLWAIQLDPDMPGWEKAKKQQAIIFQRGFDQ